MRFTIHVFPAVKGGQIVQGTLSTAERSKHWLGDRQANGEAFNGEIRVRLPRRVITAEQVRALTGRRWI